MNQYRDKLRIDTLITAVIAVVLLLVSILALVNENGLVTFLTPVAGDGHWHSRWNGFICGAAIGLLVFMIVGIIRNLKALKDDAVLKKIYVKDHDERTAEIVKSAQASAYRTTLFVELAGVIIAGYFSITVSLTILGCLYVSALIGPAYKWYFSKKL